MTQDLLTVSHLTKEFPIYGGIIRRRIGAVRAVTDVSFSLRHGETLGIVGESGCGKSTLGRAICRLYEPTSGSIQFMGQDFGALQKEKLKAARRNMQMVFQDPYASLNPRMSVRDILEEPFRLHKIGTAQERLDRIIGLLEKVGMRPNTLNRYPHEFSGGQRQRLGIARAIAMNPKLVICDEPVSALDVSIQSQVLNLLVRLQQELDLTYIFISHDLSVVHYISDRVAVMYLGRIVELAPCDDLYKSAAHPYTRALISSLPIPDPRRRHRGEVLTGDVPSPSAPPPGCHFHTRCRFAKDICKTKAPEFRQVPNRKDHFAACHFAGEL